MRIIQRHFNQPLLQLAMDSVKGFKINPATTKTEEYNKILEKMKSSKLKLEFYEEEERLLANIIALDSEKEEGTDILIFNIFGKKFTQLDEVELEIDNFDTSLEFSNYRKMIHIVQDYMLWNEKEKI